MASRWSGEASSILNRSYFELLCDAMEMCSKDPESIFVGQAVEVEGTGMSKSLNTLPIKQRLELPVDEDFQLGISIGMALEGKRVISIFPRWNFLLLAMNQLVNHLDKLVELGISIERPLIIRTAIGSEKPLYPGPQHVGDFTEAVAMMCNNIEVVRLDTKNQILREYEKALSRQDSKSTLIVEWSDRYND